MSVLNKFQLAFRDRTRPGILTMSDQLDAAEYADVMALSGKHWSEIDCTFLEKHFEVINWLSPKAFCYYLPGICCAGVKQNRPDLPIYSSIIGMLDRSPDPQNWDTFFVERWPLLNKVECEAMQEWVLWLSSEGGQYFYDNTVSRAFDTLEFVKNGVTALR
jgi:hypothetical protein